jgi:Cu(I)/Ag(I) efflux system membrane protein CusA/SilA
MTAFTTFAALLPVMLATGRGADVARAMALPVFFGMFVELVSLFIVPVFYCGYMEFKLRMGMEDYRWTASAPDQTGAGAMAMT